MWVVLPSGVGGKGPQEAQGASVMCELADSEQPLDGVVELDAFVCRRVPCGHPARGLGLEGYRAGPP
jgi:hypothetical protein